MAEIDDLLTSLIQQRKLADVSYVDEKDVKTFKIKEIPSKGQGVFAERFLSVKEPICSLGYPKISSIDTEHLATTCYHCLLITAAQLPLPSRGHKSIELKTCNGCHLARFCNKDCQVKAWHAFHKYECRIFKRMRDKLPPAIFRAVMRAVLLRDREMLSDEEWNRAIALVSHEQIMTARGPSNLTEMAIAIKHLTESSMSVDMIQKLIFIMRFNASELPTPIYSGIGVMLSPLMAKFNHSCEPNLAMRRPQHTMTSDWMSSTELSEDQRATFAQVVPLRDIEEGEEMFNCYVAPTVSVSTRSTKLAEDYFFKCDCQRCQSDTQAITDLTTARPDLLQQFEQWAANGERCLAQVGQKSDALRKSATNMDKIERYLDHPALYTTGQFPDLAMQLVLEALNHHRLDDALVNILRIQFLVNTQRFVGRHNPTNIYTIFLSLDILDVLLLADDEKDEKRKQSLQRLQTRGLTRPGLLHWRDRICADLRTRITASAVTDLLVLLDDRQSQYRTEAEIRPDANLDLDRERADEELRAALKLPDLTWTAVLRQTGLETTQS